MTTIKILLFVDDNVDDDDHHDLDVHRLGFPPDCLEVCRADRRGRVPPGSDQCASWNWKDVWTGDDHYYQDDHDYHDDYVDHS